MIVNIEFFDEEPIENVITNLNFQMDKTIFFGYEEIMKPHKKTIEAFLKKEYFLHQNMFPSGYAQTYYFDTAR